MYPKYPLIILGLIFILTTTVSATYHQQTLTTNTNNTLYVGGTGPGNYSKIQLAIDAASPGDRIYVYSGDYFERILINKTITLQGENCNKTHLHSFYYATVIQVTAPQVNIHGFSIHNASSHPYKHYAGIQGLANHLALSNLTLWNNGIGIYLKNSHGHQFKNLQLYNNGIYIDNATNITIHNSQVNKKPLVYLDHINNQQITNAGQIILNDCTNITITTGNFSNATIGIQLFHSHHISITNATIKHNTFGGIRCQDSTHLSTNHCTFSTDRPPSIRFTNVQHASISNSTFTQYSYIYILDSTAIRIHNNTLIDSGITLQNTTHCTIDHNYLADQTWAISLNQHSNYNTITYNIIDDPFGGIRLQDHSCYNHLTHNHITDGYIGIELYRYSADNTLTHNTIQHTSYGIQIQFGCTTNTLLHNHLINNSDYGIAIDHADHQHIQNNTFTNTGLTLQSIGYHTIRNNTINNLPLVYKQLTSDATITNAGQIILVSCTNIIMKHLTITNVTHAIQLLDSTNNRIQNSSFTNNHYGITLLESDINTITQNHFTNNTLSIDLEDSRNNHLTHNTIHSGGIGIELATSARNTLQHNTITDQYYTGIHLSHANRNTISYNTATHNTIGLLINDYIEWLSEFPLTSQRNTISHNNLYDNHDYNAYFENGLFNTWNNNYYNTTRKITRIPGEIYAERGWHFGSPPAISFRLWRIDWHTATQPFP